MIIQELRLKNFGKFTDKSIQLKEGMNLMYGENESGKSTIHTFIKGIFLEWNEAVEERLFMIHTVSMSRGRIRIITLAH